MNRSPKPKFKWQDFLYLPSYWYIYCRDAGNAIVGDFVLSFTSNISATTSGSELLSMLISSLAQGIDFSISPNLVVFFVVFKKTFDLFRKNK